ncbi:hypothetical protein N8J89_17610 [Crossiella sp. CA-258035]|uniref:hypothetical protein n=1 Tax=Crossiella sp. CA-258035 TaxID=2981138 RepID=UPI0024BD3CEE|nr:hypothetical protein [Crossiella sp. CA-258035]WHT22808.1 hypothetical protein N8J89_17610 [Crossiella sp. CA-258035]
MSELPEGLYRPEAVRAHQESPRGREDKPAAPIRPRWWPAWTAVSVLAAAVAVCWLVRVPVTARATVVSVDGDVVVAEVTNGERPHAGLRAQVVTQTGTVTGLVVADSPELRLRVQPPPGGLALERISAIAIPSGSRSLLLDLLG